MSPPIKLANPSAEGFCVAEKDMPKLKKAVAAHFSVQHDSLGIIGSANLTPVQFNGDARVFWADTETGTLFDPDTKRATAGNPLELVKCK